MFGYSPILIVFTFM